MYPRATLTKANLETIDGKDGAEKEIKMEMESIRGRRRKHGNMETWKRRQQKAYWLITRLPALVI